MAEPIIELEGATRHYGDRVALDRLDLSVEQGSRLAVLGANGAGKTTLLKLLCGLIRPHSGTARVLGRQLPGESCAIRGKVGLLAHDAMLYRSLTVRENLAHQARLLRVGSGRVDELIETVGLAERADEPLRNLSRGTVQRAAAARAVLADPGLILLDEPYANLDPGGRSAVEPLLLEGRTAVISGHDPATLLESADQAIGLRAGRLVFSKAADSVTPAEIEDLYR